MTKGKIRRGGSLLLTLVLVLSMLQGAMVTAHADAVDFPVQVNMAGKVSIDEIRGVRTASDNGSVTGQDVTFGDYINLNLHVTDILNAYLAQYGGVVAAESIVGSPQPGEDGAVEVSELSGQVQLSVEVPAGLSISEQATYARSESSLVGLNLASVSGNRAVFDIYMKTGSGQDVYNLYNSDRDTNLIFSVYYEGTLPAGTAIDSLCASYSMGGSLTFVNNETGDSQTIRHSAVNNRFALAGASYGVSYTWSDAPEGLSLPVNDTAYTAGSQVTVDSQYAPGYQVEGSRDGRDGIFTFSGWRDSSGNVVSVTQIPSGGGNITLSGSWTFEAAANAEYHVEYRYVSGTEGKALPDSIVPPVDENVYTEGDVIFPVDPASSTVETEDGVWTAGSFDQTVLTASPSDAPDGVIVFTQTWTFEAAEEEPAAADSEAAADSTAAVSSTDTGESTNAADGADAEDSTDTADGADAADSTDTADAAAAVDSTETVSSTDTGDATSAADSTADAAPEGEESAPEDVDSDTETALTEEAANDPEGEEQTYSVKYEFVYLQDAEEPHPALPEEVTDLLPDEETGKKAEDIVTPAEVVDEDGNPVDHIDIKSTEPGHEEEVVGTWYFCGWDEYEKEITDTDVTFTGSWIYYENDRHPVIYEPNFEEWDEEILIDLGDDKKGYENGAEVTVLANERKTKEDETEEIYIRQGYEFSGWNTQADGKGQLYQPGSKATMSKDGLRLYAVWKKICAVSYEYEPAEGSLPSAVKNVLPKAVNVNGTDKALESGSAVVLEGDAVKAVQPAQTSVTISFSEVWEFKGFTPSEQTVGTEDVVLKGRWEKKPTHSVSYKFEPSELPDAVKAVLPDKVKVAGTDQPVKDLKLVEGLKLDPIDPSSTSVKEEGASTWWVFAGYSPATATMGGSDVTFTGTWVKISYKFVSGTTGRGLPSPANNYLPTAVKVNGTEKDFNGLKVAQGNTLEPVDPSKKTITVQYGDGTKASWEFKGYTPTSATAGSSAVTFTGTWEMKSAFTITYSGNGGSGTVTDSNTYTAGQEFTVLQNNFTRSGYSFLEWNTKSDGTGEKYVPGSTYKMADPGHDLVLYAIWTQYKVTYRFVSGTSGKVLPAAVLKYLPVDNEIYATGTTIYPKAVVDANGNPKTKVKLASGGTWYWSGNWDPSSAVMSAGGVVFTGTWTFKVKYDLTYDMNGGGGAQIYDKDSPYLKDEIFQVFAGPTPPSGKYFSHWQEVKEDGTLGQEFHPGHSYKMPQRDLTLRAIWTNDSSKADTGGRSGAGGGSGFVSAADGTQNRYGDTTGADGTMSGAEDVLGEAQNARTGDERPIALYVILLAAAAAAVVGTLFIRRRRK